MSDVRLTITDPSTGEVYPVAGNEKGELKLEEPVVQSDLYVEKSGSDMTGPLTLGTNKVTLNPSGVCNFKGDVTIDAALRVNGSDIFVGSHQGPGDLLDSSDSSKQGVALGGVGYLLAARTEDTPFFVNYKYADIDPGQTLFALARFQEDGTDRIIFTPPGGGVFSSDVIVGSRGQQWMIVESGGLAHLVAQTKQVDPENLTREIPSYPSLRNIPAEVTMIEEQLQKVMERLKMIPDAGWEVWDGAD